MNNDDILIVGALSLILFGVYEMTNKTRGERNNNPLNIKWSAANDWVGQVGKEANGPFAIFSHPKFGFRAGAKILDSYRRRGVGTLDRIIATFAPSTENDTQNYINFVSRRTGFAPNRLIITDDYPLLIEAMAKLETGKDWDMTLINEGLDLV